ncbi:MAG: hypothetical protein ACYTBJ_01850 [Planctomycetota bacterium]|jgi:hypothetical protein
MTDVAEQIAGFRGTRRPRMYGKRIGTGRKGQADPFGDDKIFIDGVCSRRLGSDELLAQLEATGLDSKAIAEQIKKAFDNPKLAPRDRRMLISQVLRIIAQSEGQKIKVDPSAQSMELLQAQLDETVRLIEETTGEPIERLRLVNGPDTGQPASEGGGAQGTDREPEGGSSGDLPAATEG